MDHLEAVRQMAVEKFLLNEMTPASRDRFEQHFFDCVECAAELRAMSAFLDEAKKQLGSAGRGGLVRAARRPWTARLFTPAFVSPVFALMLILVLYQNHAIREAEFAGPELLPSASLQGGNSRGGAVSPAMVTRGTAILLSVDVPTHDQYSAYELALLSPAGVMLWRVPVSAEQAKDTVSIRVPTAGWASGEYHLKVSARLGTQETKDLTDYHFTFSQDHSATTGR